MTKLTTLLLLALALFGGSPRSLVAVEYDQAVLPLLTRPFFYGRDYFVLGSGRTKMIVQADRTDLAPAFLYLLFDADDYRQSKDKDRASISPAVKAWLTARWRSSWAAMRLPPSGMRLGRDGPRWAAFPSSRPFGGPAGCVSRK